MGETRDSYDPEMKLPSSCFGFGDWPKDGFILVDDISETVLTKKVEQGFGERYTYNEWASHENIDLKIAEIEKKIIEIDTIKPRINILCKIFGHRMYFDTHDIFGPLHCRRWRCDHTELGLEWDYPPMPKSKHDIFEKLKKFYAQPLDGCWPLKPCWVPDLKKPPKHIVGRNRLPGGPKYIVTSFRRFTFDEFEQILGAKNANR